MILNSPTTTERDHAVVDYLERVLAVDAIEFGREMFEDTSDVSEVPAAEIVSRDAKEYELADGETMSHRADRDRRAMPCWSAATSCSRRMARRRAQTRGYLFFALMVTDILSKGTRAARGRRRAPGRARLRRADQTARSRCPA